MKSLFILIILGLSLVGHTQQTDVSKLVTLLHQQDMGFRLEMIAQYQPTNSTGIMKDSVALSKTLYTKIETLYETKFSAKEIKDLYTFYSSSLGTKLLQQQGQLQSEISNETYNWEMEQQGITNEDLENPILNDMEGELIAMNTEMNETEVAAKIEEIPLPKIENLDALKALVRKDPYIINDQNILLALFGQDELDSLFEQLMQESIAEPIEEENKEIIKQ
tara:strand:+ start:121 stop:783 length:663 start_codon:yes stop_codon:yes gene_type:complete